MITSGGTNWIGIPDNGAPRAGAVSNMSILDSPGPLVALQVPFEDPSTRIAQMPQHCPLSRACILVDDRAADLVMFGLHLEEPGTRTGQGQAARQTDPKGGMRLNRPQRRLKEAVLSRLGNCHVEAKVGFGSKGARLHRLP